MLVTHRDHTVSLLRWLGVGISALLLGACATQGDIMDKLNTTLRAYEKAVRWAQFEDAYTYHKWQSGQQATLPTNMRNIRVTNYQSSAQKFEPKENIMKQTVTLRYYNTDDSRERSLKLQQEWKYFPDSEHWYLISDPVVFP
jgi:hypothetical protein